jgi:hypothetical protein
MSLRYSVNARRNIQTDPPGKNAYCFHHIVGPAGFSNCTEQYFWRIKAKMCSVGNACRNYTKFDDVVRCSVSGRRFHRHIDVLRVRHTDLAQVRSTVDGFGFTCLGLKFCAFSINILRAIRVRSYTTFRDMHECAMQQQQPQTRINTVVYHIVSQRRILFFKPTWLAAAAS